MTLYPTYDLVAAAQSQGIALLHAGVCRGRSGRRPGLGWLQRVQAGHGLRRADGTQIAGIARPRRRRRGQLWRRVESGTGRKDHRRRGVASRVSKRDRRLRPDAHRFRHRRRRRLRTGLRSIAATRRLPVCRTPRPRRGGRSTSRTRCRSCRRAWSPTDSTSCNRPCAMASTSASYNIMAMDYGDSAAPNPQGKMGDYAIAAANRLFTQLKSGLRRRQDRRAALGRWSA